MFIYSESGKFLRNVQIVSEISLYWILREGMFLCDMDGKILREQIAYVYLMKIE